MNSHGIAVQMEHVSIGTLTPDPRNARVHSKKQLAQIGASISEFGFVNPVIADETGKVIAGHGRLAAARQLGLPSVPVITLSHLTEAQKRALSVADNKIALNASWDETLLAEVLGTISIEMPEFNLGAIGFETAEVDLLLSKPPKTDPADQVEDPDRASPAVSRLGDLWQMGEHRLLCGNALELEDYEALLSGESAQQVVTDPPYNVRIDGHVGGLGAAHHAEFKMASGEMSSEEFVGFLSKGFRCVARYSASGAVVMAFMDWRHMDEILRAGRSVFAELLNLCVWAKTNGGMGSFYRSSHELVFIFKNGKAPHINNIELGKHGRYRTNVWNYAGANSFGRSRTQDLTDHPTVKPVAMIADAIQDSSRRGGIVLDPFAGSGTILIACQRAGRRGRAMELDPHYVDVAVRRWRSLYPDRPVTLAATGEAFDVVAAQRLATCAKVTVLADGRAP